MIGFLEARTPQEIVKFLEENKDDVEVISMYASNNRHYVYYKRIETKKNRSK